MTEVLDIHFSPDHPTAEGHFPGNPIIPGAVLLDEIIRALKLKAPYEVRSAKFLHPVIPGQRVSLRWKSLETGETKFECFLPDPDRLVLTGTVR